MIYTIYDPASGLIISRVRNANQVRGRAYVAGNYDPDAYRIVRGQAVPLPPKPMVEPQVVLRWNAENQDWMIDQAATAAQARQQRDRSLTLVDRMNPVWWASLTAERQQQFINYRQALLDVSRQPGWPVTIVWPAAPDWL